MKNMCRHWRADHGRHLILRCDSLPDPGWSGLSHRRLSRAFMPVQLDDEDDLTDPFDTLFDKLTQKSKGCALYDAHTYGLRMLQEQTCALRALTSLSGRCHLPFGRIMAPIAIPSTRALSFSVACLIRSCLFFASNIISQSFSENSVYIMSTLKASFDFLAADHCQRSSRQEISPDLVVKRMPYLAACRS